MSKSQQSFRNFKKISDAFGGDLLKNNPKTKRPLDSKFATHLVLRTFRSTLRLPRTFKAVNDTFENICAKYGVRLYHYANVGNHVHALINLPNRRTWSAFIRELTSVIARVVRQVTGSSAKFWLKRPFTRIVRGWRKAFQVAKEYVELNWLEGEGLIDRERSRRKEILREFFEGSVPHSG